MAAIIHNDFYYLSQEILGLAFEVCMSCYLLLTIIYLRCWLTWKWLPPMCMLRVCFVSLSLGMPEIVRWVFGWLPQLWLVTHASYIFSFLPQVCWWFVLATLRLTLVVARLTSNQTAPFCSLYFIFKISLCGRFKKTTVWWVNSDVCFCILD